MIVTTDRGVFKVLFSLTGSIVPAITLKLIVAALIGVMACLLRMYDYPVGYDFTPFTVFGVALSLFLGFRSNACYSRWWEARGHWGKQIIAVRKLGHILTSTAPENTESIKILKYASAHSHALRNQLRGDLLALADRDSFLSDGEKCQLKTCANPADKVLYFAARSLYDMKTRGDIDSITLTAIHNHLSELGEVQGACERLKNTPVPFAYTLLVYRTTWLYILLAPFALVKTAFWFTPLINTIIAYVFLGLDELAHVLEHPFSTSKQALALTAMCRTIDISTSMARGEQPPPPLAANKGVLM